MASPSGETNVPIGEWTTGTLKIYHDMAIEHERELMDERDRRYHERWAAQEEAAKNLKEYQNEFRGSLSDLSTKMATKDEMLAVAKGLSEKIEAQDKVNTEFRSRLDVGNPAIAALQNQNSLNQGQTSGSDKTWEVIGKVVPILVGIGGLLYGIFK